jgi:hypothetical protein
MAYDPSILIFAEDTKELSVRFVNESACESQLDNEIEPVA